MTLAPSQPPDRRPVDVRTLSVVQLQKLASAGSRRARAELEMRMGASTVVQPATVTARRHPDAAAAPPTLTRQYTPVATVPDMDEVLAATARSSVAAPTAARATARAAHVDEAHGRVVDQLELMARQDQQRARADGPPRLVGMAMIVWGALLLIGALVMLGYGSGGVYYLFCALAAGAIGWLLMQRNRFALPVHGVLLLLALAWAWRGAAGSLITALVQASPLLIPALWMLARPVREPLE